MVSNKVSFYFGLWTTILLLVASGSVNLTNVVPADWIPYVQAWSSFLGAINSAILTALNGYASNAAGPLVSKATVDAAKKLAIITLMILPALAAMLLASPVMAQTKLAAGRSANDGGPIASSADADPKAAAGIIGKVLAKPFQDLADLLNGDMDGAIALSTAIPDLQDGNGQACWIALRSAGKVFKEHPVPLTFHAATDIEGFRLLVMAANRLCTNSACTQVFADGANIITAISPLPIPAPSLNAICAKIPAIAVVAPVSAVPAAK